MEINFLPIEYDANFLLSIDFIFTWIFVYEICQFILYSICYQSWTTKNIKK